MVNCIIKEGDGYTKGWMSSKDFLWDKGDFSEDKSGSREGENVFMYMGGGYCINDIFNYSFCPKNLKILKIQPMFFLERIC